MISIRGFSSRLAQTLIDILPPDETARPVERGAHEITERRHLFAQGFLSHEQIGRQTRQQIGDSFMANAAMTIQQCDRIFAINPEARVCVIGSESGFSWSFDGAYAGAKAALHRYVETKKLPHPGQQLICIAPGIISDAGMTTRRADQDNVKRRAVEHRKGRHLTCIEVARLIHYVLYIDEGYLSGVVIRMNGGSHAQ